MSGDGCFYADTGILAKSRVLGTRLPVQLKALARFGLFSLRPKIQATRFTGVG